MEEREREGERVVEKEVMEMKWKWDGERVVEMEEKQEDRMAV